MEATIVAKYKQIEKELKYLNFSSYESAVYLSLLGKNEPMLVSEITEQSALLRKKIPITKIYSVLKRLEDKGLVEKIDSPLRYSIHFDKKHLKDHLENLMQQKKKQLERDELNIYDKLERIWDEFLAPLREKDDIWRIYSTNEAGRVSLAMCKRATKEIRIMTEYGGWIHNNKDFRDTLEQKSMKGVKIWALIADMDSVERTRKNEREEFENFLKGINARYYCYTPKALRMTVTDKSEALFFMFKPEKGSEPIIYYTGLRDIAESLAEYFSMKCLYEYELKSFIKSKTKDKRFSDLQDLLFV